MIEDHKSQWLGGRFGNRFEDHGHCLWMRRDYGDDDGGAWRTISACKNCTEISNQLLQFLSGIAVLFISFLGVLSDRGLMACGGREGDVKLARRVVVF